MKDRKYLVLLFVIALVALLLFSILEVSAASNLGFPLDDSWIFWVFAKNLATGEGFSFNPGEPVLGTTSILWVLILAGSYLLTHSVVFISKFWGVLFFLVSIFLTYRICLYYIRKEKVAFLGALIVALSPPLIFGALSGMEISLATLLLCLTLYFHLREKGKDRRIFLAPIFGALCFTARPELIALYPLLLVHDWVNRESRGDQRDSGVARSIILKKALTFAIFLSPAFIFNYLVTGSFLPHTFAAKTMDSGLIWAIRNGNVDELIISLTLNPLIWGGTMLISLVSLNAPWAVFWSRGLVYSFLRRDTFIYPLIFLIIPMLRGALAPVTNSLYMEQRYASFLLPLLAVFFVTGWGESRQVAEGKEPYGRLRKWLCYLGGAGLITSFAFYLSPLVGKDEVFRLLAGPLLPSVLNFAQFKFALSFTAAFILFAAFIGTSGFWKKPGFGRAVVCSLLVVGVLLQAAFLADRGQRFAMSVKNINDMQVHLGQWVNRNIPRGSLLAINDIGAIKFFGNRKCLDLEGLALPQIVPYKIMGKESYVVYLDKHRPDYFIIFPWWYPEVYAHLGLFERVLYGVELDDNVVCGGPDMTVSQPNWELFDSLLQNTGLLDTKPYIPEKSFRRRWDDALLGQLVPPDWKAYQMKGRESWGERDLKAAREFYQKAESYCPQHHKFYMELGSFYMGQGDTARAAAAFENAVKYQLFPFPDYRTLIER